MKLHRIIVSFALAVLDFMAFIIGFIAAIAIIFGLIAFLMQLK